MLNVTQPKYGFYLLFCLLCTLLWITPAKAQLGWGSRDTEGTYRGEIKVFMTDGSVRESDKVGLIMNAVRFGGIFSEDRVDAELVDHVEIVTNSGKQLYLANFSITTTSQWGLFSVNGRRWLTRDFLSDRMQVWIFETTVYNADPNMGYGYSKQRTYFYQKDDGALRPLVPEAVMEDVADNEASLDLALKAKSTQTVSKVSGYLGAGLVVGSILVFFSDSIGDGAFVGMIGGAIVSIFTSWVTGLSVQKNLLQAVKAYQ